MKNKKVFWTNTRKRKILSFANEITYKLFLKDWIISYRFIEKDPEADSDGGKTVATTNALVEYKKGVIEIYRGIYEEDGKKGLSDSCKINIIHELSHLITMEFSNAAENRYSTEKELRDLNEKLTQEIAVIVFCLMKK